MVDWLTSLVGDFMHKVNGRFKKEEQAEAEKLVGKPFKCTRCSYVEFRKKVEFGEELICPDCGALLREIINF
ncbi:MAG: hypothetical protein EHM79_19925 [Geobacter sp.]|nr:MAG: hypothetical protein EHM79_19925 [Geobacter sp.]